MLAWCDPVTMQKVQATPGMTGTDFYRSVIIAIWTNNAKKLFQDPRVRRALHLALDRHALVNEIIRYDACHGRGVQLSFLSLCLPRRRSCQATWL